MLFPNPLSAVPESSSVSDEPEFEIWDYNPSIPAAAVAAGVCGLLTLLHTYRLAQHKTVFCIPFIVGGNRKFLAVFSFWIRLTNYKSSKQFSYACRVAADNNNQYLPRTSHSSYSFFLSQLFSPHRYMRFLGASSSASPAPVSI